MQNVKKGVKIYKRKFGLKFTEFKNALENGEDFCVCLFEGEDAFFQKRGLELLKAKFLTEPSINYVSFDENVTGENLISSLEAYPFMSKKRFTVVNNFYPSAEILKTIEGFLNNPLKEGLFVILNDKPFEKFKKYSAIKVIDCSKSSSELIARWIKAKCTQSGVEIDGQTASLIAEYCLLDMSRVEMETAKLIDYVWDKKIVCKQDVDEMVAQDTEFKIYQLTDYIGKKKFSLALSIINEMRNKGETPQRLLSSIYNYFRKLLHVAISNKSIAEIANSLDIKEYPAKKLKEQSEFFKKKALKNAVDVLTDADFKIKSGLSDVDEQFYISLFKIITSES